MDVVDQEAIDDQAEVDAEMALALAQVDVCILIL
jgi:hypothetical protein